MWNFCAYWLKRIGRGIIAAIIAPISAVASIPKMYRIYRDPDIEIRHFTIMSRIFRRCRPAYFIRPPGTTILRMKHLVVAKYKISIKYLRFQNILHYFYFSLGLGTFGLTLLMFSMDCLASLSTPYPSHLADDLSQMMSIGWKITGIIVLIITGGAGFNEMFRYPNSSYLSSALDEITAICKCCCKNSRRNIEEHILKANLSLGLITASRNMLARTERPALHQELLDKRRSVNHTQEILSQTMPLPHEINNLILGYTFPEALIFSAGKPIALAKFDAFNQKNLPLISEEIVIDIDPKDVHSVRFHI